MLLYDGIEKQFREYQSLFDEIFIDPPKVKSDIQKFGDVLDEIKEICNLLKRMMQFHKDNFKASRSKLQLISFRLVYPLKTLPTGKQVEKYIKKIFNLKSKLFGIILKRKELEKVNHDFLNNFPSWNVQHPHKRIRRLEMEHRFYRIFLDSRKELEKYANIDKRYFFWTNLENIIEHLNDFDFDTALENIRNVLPNFIQKLEAIKATSYFEELTDNYALQSIDSFKNLSIINCYINLLKDIIGTHKMLQNRGVDVSRKNLIDVGLLLDANERTNLKKTAEEIEDVVAFYVAKKDLLGKIGDLEYNFPSTIAKIKIDASNPNTLVHNELCILKDRDIQELCNYLGEYYSIKEKFESLKISHYGRERSDLENKLVLKMTHILDSAVVNFRNENLNDQQQIRDLIRKKKRIPKELLRKLVEAFPCLIVNIRDLGEYLPLEPEVFDIVIIDEASQVSIAQSFPAILRGKKVIVFGDKKQYSNVKSHNASKEINNFLFSQVRETYNSYISNYHEDKRQVLSDIIDMFDIKRSILDFLKRIANYSCSLRKHFRGYREIIGYSNKQFYNNYLQVMKIRSRPLDTVLHFHILSDVDKIDVYQNTNSYECDYIISKLEELKEKGIEQSVGIITPFTNQQRYIYGKILSHEDSDYFLEKMNLKVMTFDTCQGDEKDIIFYSFVERNDESILRYIFPKDLKKLDDEEEGTIKAQRLNVGFSRAREEMHFVLSKDTDEILGEIGRALRFYESELKETEALPESSECQSEMEKLVLSYITQTNFYEKHKENLEIHAQFEIGKYLKQLYDIDIPKYRTDFLLVFRDDGGKVYNIIIEYDGFEFHFKDQDSIGIENYGEFYIAQDIERQKTLESYGYDFIRLNRFIMGNDPIGFLDKRLSEISKKKLNKDHFIEKVLTDAERIKNKEIKQCPKCGIYRDIKDFRNRELVSGFSRYCKNCRDKKDRLTTTDDRRIYEATFWQLDDKLPKKKCTKCGKVKNTKEFRFRKTRNYYESICKECEKEEKRKYKKQKYSVKEPSRNIISKRQLLEEAINNNKKLHMVYKNIQGKTSSRDIKPLYIDGGYLRAYCYLRGEERTFLIDRITQLD
ncbi:AAA domain-containing protein [Candidatus Omnitrophota bacterium]